MFRERNTEWSALLNLSPLGYRAGTKARCGLQRRIWQTTPPPSQSYFPDRKFGQDQSTDTKSGVRQSAFSFLFEVSVGRVDWPLHQGSLSWYQEKCRAQLQSRQSRPACSWLRAQTRMDPGKISDSSWCQAAGPVVTAKPLRLLLTE